MLNFSLANRRVIQYGLFINMRKSKSHMCWGPLRFEVRLIMDILKGEFSLPNGKPFRSFDDYFIEGFLVFGLKDVFCFIK